MQQLESLEEFVRVRGPAAVDSLPQTSFDGAVASMKKGLYVQFFCTPRLQGNLASDVLDKQLQFLAVE